MGGHHSLMQLSYGGDILFFIKLRLFYNEFFTILYVHAFCQLRAITITAHHDAIECIDRGVNVGASNDGDVLHSINLWVVPKKEFCCAPLV